MITADHMDQLAKPAVRKKHTPLIETAMFKQFKKSMSQFIPPVLILALLLLIWVQIDRKSVV